MQLLRLRYHLLLKNCIDYALFHCFLVKFTKFQGILSNFETQKGGKTKQFPGLEKSQVAYKKIVYLIEKHISSISKIIVCNGLYAI